MKILLVDDSKSARYALRLQLQRHDIDVDTAESAEAAFEVLKGELPDAILMDHMMPGLNGFEALDIIKEDPRTAHIPVVMCTSHEEPDFVETAHKKGVLGILPKSMAPERLPEILELLQNQLDATSAGSVETSAQAPSEGLSDQALTDRIEGHLHARLAQLVTPMIEDLRRDLTEQLMVETRQLIDSQLAEVRANARATLTAEDFQAKAKQAITAILPDLVRVEIEAEHGRIIELIEAQRSKPLNIGSEIQAMFDERAADIGHAATNQALIAARRETNETVAQATEQMQQALAALKDNLKETQSAEVKQAKLFAGLAALVGIGAAAAVFFLGA